MRGIDRVGSCKENVWRNVRYLIELRAVRSLFREIARYSIELSCKEFVRKVARFLKEFGVVRSLLGEL